MGLSKPVYIYKKRGGGGVSAVNKGTENTNVAQVFRRSIWEKLVRAICIRHLLKVHWNVVKNIFISINF